MNTFTITLPENFSAALRGLESGTLRRPLNADGGVKTIEDGIRSILRDGGQLLDWQFASVARQVLPAYRQGQRTFRVNLVGV